MTWQVADRKLQPYLRPTDAAKRLRLVCNTEKGCFCTGCRQSVPPSGTTVRSQTADLLLRGAATFKGSLDQVVQLLAKVLNRHKDAEEGCAAYLVLYIARVKFVYMNDF